MGPGCGRLGFAHSSSDADHLSRMSMVAGRADVEERQGQCGMSSQILGAQSEWR